MTPTSSQGETVLEPHDAGPRKILFLHYGDDWIRGSEEMLLQLLKSIDREKFEPVVVCNQEVFRRAVESMGVPAQTMSIPEIMIEGWYLRLGFLSYVKAYKRLRRIIKREQPDLLYCNTGLPCQISVPAARRSRIPVICHMHSVPASRRHYWIWLVKYAHAVVFCSNDGLRMATSRCSFPNETVVVYNGIDHLDQFHPVSKSPELRRSLGVGEHEVVIGQVGSLIDRKGCDILIEAFGQVVDRAPESRLVFVGDGERRQNLEAMARESGYGDRIIFTGEVSRDSVQRYMQQVFDINVLASHAEGLPLVVLQGAACELPCVVTDSTGLAETVVEGVTGFHFDPGDTGMLADRLTQLAKSTDLRREMGEAGRSMVDRKFSIASYVRGIEDAITGALSRV